MSDRAADADPDRADDRGSSPGGPSVCRPGCGACCIAPSISTPLPKMPFGKPAGVVCAHLTASRRCELFGRPERPAVCGGLQPSAEMCGESPEHALVWLDRLERATAPDVGPTVP